MLLNPYVYIKKEHYLDPDSVKKSGIVDRERKITVIKLHQNIDVSDSIFGKYQMNFVLLANFSHTKDNNGEDRYIKNTYGFTYTSTSNDAIREFLNSKLRLVYATSTGFKTYDDYYKDEFYDDLGFTFIETVDNDPFEICIDDMNFNEEIVSGTLKVPDPRYYTNKQFEIDNNREFDGICQEGLFYFYGKDIYDDITVMESLNMDSQLGYDDGVKCSNQKGELVPVNIQMDGDYIEKICKINNIPLVLFADNAKSCFKSYKFIYDSKMSYNIKDIKTYRNISEYRKLDYLKDITNKLRKIGKEFEEIYGNIRFMYYFSDIEDSAEVIFDDEGKHKIRYNYNKKDIYERIATNLFDKYERFYQRYTMPYNDIRVNLI